MINFYRRHQCWIFQLSGAAGVFLAADGSWWVFAVIGGITAVPAAIQDRRNRRTRMMVEVAREFLRQHYPDGIDNPTRAS